MRWPAMFAVLVLGGVALALGALEAGAAHGSSAVTKLEPSFSNGVTAASDPSSIGSPSGFQDTVALSGLTNPIAVRFSPDGRVFVAEKSGILLEYDGLGDATPTTVADLRTEVNDYWDRGMLGLALDPGFPAKPYVYVLYSYDAPPGQSAPHWNTTAPYGNDNCPSPPGGTVDGCVITGKLVRIQVGTNSTMVGSPMPLINDQWCQQFPSHSIGDLQFGADGALYVSAGEGASFSQHDWGQLGGTLPNTPTLANPCGDPPQPAGTADTSPTSQGGSLRSQSPRRTSGPTVLNGTLLRIKPDTGAGLPGNPFFGSPGADANKQRIVAYGLRNPFRFTFRPGTNELWIGDVGDSTWEEIDRDTDISTVQNYGWPCYEGPAANPTFSGFDLCTSLPKSATAAPYYSYKHGAEVVPNDGCPTSNSAITGVSFYDASAGNYPFAYNGALFFADHSRNCIWAMLPGANGLPDPTKIQTFVRAAGHPVDLEVGPGGDLFYVDLEGGAIHRISYSPSAVGTCPAGSYDAKYFNNRTLSGPPVFERCESTPNSGINQDWGTASPDPSIDPSSFSARWTGSFTFSPGSYNFTATAADGVRVFVDGQLLINEFVDKPPSTSATTRMTGGTHTITIEYYHRSANAYVFVNWEAAPDTPTPRPTPSRGPPVVHSTSRLTIPAVVRFRGHTTKLRLRCIGSGRCLGALRIQNSHLTPRAGTARKAHRRLTVTYASGRFSIAGGRTGLVTVTLSKPGRQAISARRSLKAYANLTFSSGRVQSARITLQR